MKKAIITVIAMFLLICWPLGGLWDVILSPVIGGGASETYLYPIYGGIILLSGAVVGCTSVVCERIQQLKDELKDKDKNASEDNSEDI